MGGRGLSIQFPSEDQSNFTDKSDVGLISLSFRTIQPPMGWTITQHGNDKITGMVRSKSASKDQLEIHYNQILQGTSPDEITFAKSERGVFVVHEAV
jgi:hypothetical protein